MKRFISTLIFIAICAVVIAQEKGKASYYADKFEGRKTASGEIYQHQLKTAAHKTLPFGTKVKVTNLANNKSVVVKINDRGPFIKGRIIDLSKSAASEIDGVLPGIIDVKIEVIK
ncbi:septal ring lytic transglycosylase RlpA family protein [Labilibacter marinus]|uniref:septal ring lytic transglycosylase RlpA family protein n=1 Tax=Labilibacter marinus TaxID=1477105 RepID=UPI00082E9285|nr:septal ring lytic transglycosylase RlpA family protein [Labilibacter marinus]